MKKHPLVSIVLALALVVLTALTSFAQQPEQIDIQSLKIVHGGIQTEATISYKNSAQSLVSFTGWANYSLPYTSGGIRLPNTLSSNGFANFGIVSSAPGGGGDYRLRFYLSSSESDPIVLRPTILRKRREIVATGTTIIRGRVEVIDQRTLPNKIIAVDNNFELTGNFRAVFTQPHGGTQRFVIYQGIIYNLVQTQ